MAKKIAQVLIILLAMAVLAACGNDNADDNNGNNNSGDEIVAGPTPPTIVIQQQQVQATPTPTPQTADPQVIEPHELTRTDFIADLVYFLDALDADFLHFGIVYRRFGVDFRQNAAELLDIIADENFEIDLDIFTQLMLDNFFMHPDITYSVAGWHFDGQSQRSDGFVGTSGHVETRVLEEGRIGYIRINCFNLRGLGAPGNATRTVENFLSQTADFEHMIIDIRGVDGNPATEPWIDALILPNITEDIIRQRVYMFMRETFRFAAGVHPLPVSPITRMFDVLPVELDLELGLVSVRYSWVSIMPPLDATPFAGQIWLLIDGGVGGVPARFADLAAYAGVATLVGQPIGGDMSAPDIFVVDGEAVIRHIVYDPPAWQLPNTQIPFAFHTFLLTDHLGRAADEYVTQPHVLVPDDVDALEYLLEMIWS